MRSLMKKECEPKAVQTPNPARDLFGPLSNISKLATSRASTCSTKHRLSEQRVGQEGWLCSGTHRLVNELWRMSNRLVVVLVQNRSVVRHLVQTVHARPRCRGEERGDPPQCRALVRE